MSAASPFVWFDFGGVLSPPLDDLFSRYEEVTGIPVSLFKFAIAEVGAEYGLEPLAPIELGIVDERTWVRKLHAVIRTKDPDLDLSRSDFDFGAQWFAGHAVNSTIRDLAVELADSGVRVGVLSNNVVEWEPHWHRMIELDGVVTDLVDSCRVGVRKPDPAIFRLAAERNGVEPERNVLIDDLAENCSAAAALGWKTVRFETTDQAVSDVRRIVDQLTA